MPVTLSPTDREALGRLTYAEAGNQGASGQAGVVFAVLNRLASGRFGDSIQTVVDAPGQFEPVQRAGGTWRNLPPLTQVQNVSFATILDLIVEGRLPDPTKGALFFQNPAIVASRESARMVSPGLTNFGSVAPAAVIRDHAFYRHVGVRQSQRSSYDVRSAPQNRTLWLRVERNDAGIHVVHILDGCTTRPFRTRFFRFGGAEP